MTSPGHWRQGRTKRADGWLLALLLVSVLANALLGSQLIQMRNREVGHPAPGTLTEVADVRLRVQLPNHPKG